MTILEGASSAPSPGHVRVPKSELTGNTPLRIRQFQKISYYCSKILQYIIKNHPFVPFGTPLPPESGGQTNTKE